MNPAPSPPLWALEAGLPPPKFEESFEHYCTRLGLDAYPLLVELEPRTYELANVRLESRLVDAMPKTWEQYVDARVRAARARYNGRH